MCVVEANQQIQMIAAGKSAERFRTQPLPEDEKQLRHSFEMTDEIPAAGELDIPIEWLESLAVQPGSLCVCQGCDCHGAQGVNTSARLDPMSSVQGSNSRKRKPRQMSRIRTARLHIVRRLFRYRERIRHSRWRNVVSGRSSSERILGILA